MTFATHHQGEQVNLTARLATTLDSSKPRTESSAARRNTTFVPQQNAASTPFLPRQIGP